MPIKPRPKGGAREGAGRPLNAVTIRTKDIANRLANDGQPQPLEIMVATARYFYGLALGSKSKKSRDSYYGRAAVFASQAAPYMHSKMANIDPNTGETERPLLINLGTNAAAL